jgi:hypothetical protein
MHNHNNNLRVRLLENPLCTFKENVIKKVMSRLNVTICNVSVYHQQYCFKLGSLFSFSFFCVVGECLFFVFMIQCFLRQMKKRHKQGNLLSSVVYETLLVCKVFA